MRPTLALAACLALLSCKPNQPAYAAPPPGASPSPDVAAWFQSLRSVRTGAGCCDLSDCRRTAVRVTPDQLAVEAWIGREEFGPGAPDQWRRVPLEEIHSRGNRPPGVEGAIICFNNDAVLCADLDGGV